MPDAKGNATAGEWDDLRTASKRLKRNPGHLRKLCPSLAARGLARYVRLGKRRRGWQIHRSFELAPHQSKIALPDYGHLPIVVSVGDSVLTLEVNGPARVTIETPARSAGKSLTDAMVSRGMEILGGK